jgi:ribosomal protein S18 acetylase RimI-like enzyme
MTTAVRTYLEMRSPGALNRAPRPGSESRVDRVRDCPPSFWRYLYAEVGRAYHWVDRLSWSDADIRHYLTDPSISLWLLSVAGAPAGYFELKRHDDGSIEIAYFGLLEQFHGRGLGAYLLSEAAGQAWAAGASRVWLHTSTLDHAHAKSNYLKRGFTIFATEEYTVPPI